MWGGDSAGKRAQEGEFNPAKRTYQYKINRCLLAILILNNIFCGHTCYNVTTQYTVDSLVKDLSTGLQTPLKSDKLQIMSADEFTVTSVITVANSLSHLTIVRYKNVCFPCSKECTIKLWCTINLSHMLSFLPLLLQCFWSNL